MKPTGMIAPFGPVTTVIEANCRFERVTGDSVIDARGIVHAFIAFAGGSCQAEPVIHYVTGRLETWTPTPTPYRGNVLGMAIDSNQAFLLYANSQGVHITKRAADGQFTSGRPVSRPSSPEWVSGQGDVVASNGRWWAVWTERANPTLPFELFQASTMTSDGERRRERIASAVPHAVHNIQPTLVLDPADPGGAALGWTVVTEDAAVIRFARARQADARWREQAWVPRRPEPGRHVNAPDLAAGDGGLDGAFEDDGTIMQVHDVPADVAGVRFPTQGVFPRTTQSAGRTLLAWTSNPFPDHAHVLVGVSDGGAGVEVDLTPTAGDQQLLGLMASEGKAAVLGVSFVTNRLWARTQT